MDIRMPTLDGLEATRRILIGPEPCPRVIVLTTFDLDEYVYEALRVGASGFLLLRHERLAVAAEAEQCAHVSTREPRLVDAGVQARLRLGVCYPIAVRAKMPKHAACCRTHGPPRRRARPSDHAKRDRGARAHATTRRELAAKLDELTEREREVFRLLARGLSNAEIARACR